MQARSVQRTLRTTRVQRVPAMLLAATLVSVTLMSACGFHLQGRMPLPESLKSIRLQVEDEQSDFVHALREGLLRSGAALVERTDTSAAIVRITKDAVTERVLTVSARNIPTDYELDYEVELSVSVAGRDVIAPEKLSLSRVYSFDESKLLAKEREKQVLLDALARDMASVVLRRLSSL